MELVNLTPHALSLLGEPGFGVELAPSGQVARVATVETPVAPLAGLPVVSAALGPVEGLPAPRPGVAYIVSRLVFEATPDRADVFAPGAPVRDAGGRIVGAMGLVGREAPPRLCNCGLAPVQSAHEYSPYCG